MSGIAGLIFFAFFFWAIWKLIPVVLRVVLLAALLPVYMAKGVKAAFTKGSALYPNRGYVIFALGSFALVTVLFIAFP